MILLKYMYYTEQSLYESQIIQSAAVKQSLYLTESFKIQLKCEKLIIKL